MFLQAVQQERGRVDGCPPPLFARETATLFESVAVLLIAFGLLSLPARAGTLQTITFPEIPDQISTGGPLSLGASASSGLAVTYSIVSPAGVATLGGNRITLTGSAGSVTVKASQAGNGTFDPAPAAYQTFAVGLASQRFVKLSKGPTAVHDLGIRADGTLWAWGDNTYGQLGDGTTTKRATPVQITGATNWASVACSYYGTAAVRSDGTLWGWGNGGVGDGTTLQRKSPVRVGTDTDWVAVSRGSSHTLGLKSNGTLWSWGSNSKGQLGDGTTTSQYSPIQVGSDTDWTFAVCGADFNAALKTDGTLWTWGDNSKGQLGNGTTSNSSIPVQIGSNDWSKVVCGSSFIATIKTNGTLWTWGSNTAGALGDGTTGSYRPTPAQVGGASNWSSIFAASLYVAALTTDGSLYTWGYNDTGPLGDGTFTSRNTPTYVGWGNDWVDVNCTQYHMVALKAGGTLWAWGSNEIGGGLGNGSTTVRNTPAQITLVNDYTKVAGGYAFSMAVKQDNSLWGWGSNTNGQAGDGTALSHSLPVQVGSANWSSIACGSWHTASVKTDGTLWVWGSNVFGQLGDGTTTQRNSPVQVGIDSNWAAVACGNYHSVAVKSDGTLWAWGYNYSGQLGDGTTSQRYSPIQIGNGTNWMSAACGNDHTTAVRSDGTLWAWGSNTSGQLGDGTTTRRTSPVQIGSDSNWATVTCGQFHTMAIKTDGTLWAWGYNSNGQLGDGTTTQRTSPVQVGSDSNWASVACGSAHSMAIKTDNTLWACGYNNYGQLGDGTTTQRSSLKQIISNSTCTAVACGSSHTLAAMADGTISAWGYNSNGQLGDGTSVDRIDPTQVDNITAWTKVASGSDYTIALGNQGALWSWGNSSSGQLGDNSVAISISRFSPQPVSIFANNDWASVACGSAHTLAIKTDGSLWAWGYGGYGQFGDGTTTTTRRKPGRVGSANNWASIACGGSHTAALKTDGTLWNWGYNNTGQLGNGTTTQSASPVQVSSGSTWLAVACGSYHTVAVRSNHTLWAWGLNSSGQLGDGTKTNQSTPTQVGADADWAQVACGQSITVALKTDGTLWTWGSNVTSPVQVGSDTTWNYVACGDSHTMAIKSDRTLWAWGSNSNGQLGDGTLTFRNSPVQVGGSGWASVAGGSSHTVALKSDGTLWTWGRNAYGQLGNGTAAVPFPKQTWPTQAGQSLSFANLGTLAAGQSVPLNATASSGLPVTYTVDGGQGTLNGNLLIPTAPGSLTITARQEGDASWQSASPVSVSAMVIDSPTLALSTPADITSGGAVLNGTVSANGAATTVQFEYGLTTSYGSTASVTLSPNDSFSAQNVSSAITGLSFSTLYHYRLTAVNAAGTSITTDGTFTTLAAPLIVVEQPLGSALIDGISSVDLGGVVLGATSSLTFTIKNSGTATLSGLALSLDGAAAGDFTADTTGLPATLPPGGNATFMVNFSPSQFGARPAYLHITSNDDPRSPFDIMLTSTGIVAPGPAQNIFFSEISDQLSTASPVELTALGSSGLPVSYTLVSPPGVATLGGSTLSLTGAGGSVTIKASQAGNGTYAPAPDVYRTFVVVQASQRFVKVASGSWHSAGIRADGTLWIWGRNDYNQLGDGTTTQRDSPIQIGSASDWASVACGLYHTVAIKTDGTLWAWGSNGNGQLGDGTTTQRSSPIQVNSASDWASVACGQYHTVAIKTNGTLWSWGWNGFGQLGDGTATQRNSPIQIGSASDWASVASGHFYSMAIKTGGQLWAWGDNRYGQLGDATTTQRNSPVQIGSAADCASVVCGQYHTLFIRTNNSLWACGLNAQGRLGDGTTTNRTSPVQVGTASNWVSAACGRLHSLAINSDGTLWTWGDNTNGQLGDATNTPHSAPMRVGSTGNWAHVDGGDAHTLAVKADGTLWAWGANGYGQFGQGSTNPANNPLRSWPTQSAQSLDFPSPTSVITDQPVVLAATAASGLPVTYTVSGPATLNGNILTPTAPGLVTITASQPGDSNWLGATPLVQVVMAIASPTPGLTPPSMVFATSVTLNGTVNPNGAATTAQFEYGPTTTYGSTASVTLSPNNGITTQNVSRDLINLTYDTVYFYRLTATNSVGINTTAQGSFTTPTPLSLFQESATGSGLKGQDAAPDSTPHHDGVPNLIKFAFNMNLASADVSIMPFGGNHGLPAITTPAPSGATGIFRFEFLRRIGSGLVYTPQKSSNLTDPGSWTALTDTPTIVPIDATWERVIYEEPYDANTTPHCFGRVQVTLPP